MSPAFIVHGFGDGTGITINPEASGEDRTHGRGHIYWSANPDCLTCKGSGIIPVTAHTHAHDLKACGCVGLRVGDTPSGYEPWQLVSGITCVVCPGCGFTFDSVHTDDSPDGGYTCPDCGTHGFAP